METINKKTQSDPLHSPEKRELKLQPSLRSRGTNPLGAERKGDDAASSKSGLHLEVEEESAIIPGFKKKEH
jgi:hypothetical protein